MEENQSETLKSAESNLRSAAADTGTLLEAAKEQGSERYAAARDKLKEHWAEAKDDLGNLRQKAMDYSQSAARATNTFAHDHPWTTAGAAVGVGALIGWLVTRRGDMTRSHR